MAAPSLADGLLPLDGVLIVSGLWVAIAIAGWFGLRETFHDDLDYLEQ